MNLMKIGRFLTTAARVGAVSSAPSEAIVSEVAERIELGVVPSQIRTAKVTLASLLVDDSGSMEWAHEAVVSAIQGSIQQIRSVSSRHDILLGVLGICHGWLLPYTRIDSVNFDGDKYSPDGGSTPLYDRASELLISLAAKQGQLAEVGIETRSVSLILTDGLDRGSMYTPEIVRAQMSPLLARKQNLVYGFAFGDQASGALRKIGIPADYVKNGKSIPDLQAAFQQFSRATSAIPAAPGSVRTVSSLTVR